MEMLREVNKTVDELRSIRDDLSVCELVKLVVEVLE